MTDYRVTYERVGRRGGRDNSPAPAPLTVSAADGHELAEHIYKNIRPYLGSRDVEVGVDLELMRGWIFCGMNNGGSFTVEAVQATEGGVAR